MPSSHNGLPFRLSESFVEKYKKIKPPFGFNGLGELVYRRTYSRIKLDGTNEEWFETIERVINGTYNMQKKWVEQHSLGWNAWQAQKSAQEMYTRMFYMKFLPPGRGLWAMGSALTEEKELFAALNNCGFTSTQNLKDNPSGPFTFLMDASMLGVGVGFDTKGAGTIHIKGPNENRKQEIFVIPDSREGWVESLRLLLESYFHGTASIEFDYSLIRKEGEQIKGFGGISSGSAPLIDLHKRLSKILDKEIGQPISVRTIVDIMNLIGRCVVSGNIRRCLPSWFSVLTNDGFKNIKDLNIGDQVVTFSGNKKITNKFDNGKQKLFKILTKNGTSYEATSEHVFLVFNKVESFFCWKKLKNIDSKTDCLVKPILKD